MKRVAVLVSGGGTNLQALIDAWQRGELPDAKLVAVLSSRQEAGALRRAEAAGIPARVVERRTFENADAYDAALVEALALHRAEVVVLAGFMTILGPHMLKAYDNRIVNVHPALLPAFGGRGFYGLRVHAAALARGVKLTGATVHLVNDVVDGGRILAQKAVPVQAGDTPETLQRRVMEQAEWVLLPQAVQQLCRELEDN